MNYYQVVLFSASVFIATVIGWVRFLKTDPASFPFLLCLTFASVNEMISYLVTSLHIDTNLNNNLYVLLEALLITWQFRKWGLFMNKTALFLAIQSSITLFWLADNLLLTGLYQLNLYFRIFYSFLIVIMSIHMNNILIFTYRRKLLQSHIFLICSGLIIYFTYKILIEAFWLYGLNSSREFRISVYLVLTWINLFVNIIYALAMLWIPKKPQHITLS